MKLVYKILLASLGLVLVTLIGALFLLNHFEYSPKYSLVSPTEYTQLFDETARIKTTLYVTNIIRGRSPIAQYIYDNDFSVVIYHIDVLTNASLYTILRQGSKSPKFEFGKIYPLLHIGLMDLSYATDSLQANDHISFSMYGDSGESQFKTNTVWCFKLKMSAFVLENEKRYVDFSLRAHDLLQDKISTEIAFVRAKGGVFLMIISPLSASRTVPSYLAKNLLSKNLFEK